MDMNNSTLINLIANENVPQNAGRFRFIKT
jgi:hypothetical protein